MADLDDDVIPAMAEDPKFPWFERPAPSIQITFLFTAISFVLTCWFYGTRVKSLKTKFGDHFKGSLRVCALISAYMDNYGFPRFATLKLCTKSFLFLGLLQINFHQGFVIMWGILIVESSLDTIRVFLAYHNCASLANVDVVSDEEALDMRATTTLAPTNVYEDLTRPKSIAVMVFLVQGLLIGLVMYDTYETQTRTCFNGHDGCPMLTSLGSYCLYLMGTFMACVFYIGPRNSYGQKEQNPTFWLKLFLMSKERALQLTWTDKVTDQAHSLWLCQNDWRISLRFWLSYLVNGVGFHFLLHLLPIQVAGQSTIIGVVFRAIGMIYLADLDDSQGSTMMAVQMDNATTTAMTSEGLSENATTYGAIVELDTAKQQIVDKALADVKAQMEALMIGGIGASKVRANRKFVSITNALLLSASLAKRNTTNEETPLV